MVNISGAAVTKNAKNRENAKKKQEYPIIKGVETSDILKSWGNYLPLSELEKHLFEAVMLADKCKWK